MTSHARKAGASAEDVAGITEGDVSTMIDGTHGGLRWRLGPRPERRDGREGAAFAVWLADADSVAVAGDFNSWDPAASPLAERTDCPGLWEGFVAGAREGDRYCYHVVSGAAAGFRTDPFADTSTPAPAAVTDVSPLAGQASVVRGFESAYDWGDGDWMKNRGETDPLAGPLSIYSIDPQAWRCVPGEGGRPLASAELAPYLEDHLRRTGFTHVGFAPSPGEGTPGFSITPPVPGPPGDFRGLVDRLHRAGKGVVVSLRLPEPPADDSPEARGLYSSTVLSVVLAWFEDYHADLVDIRLPESVAASLMGPGTGDVWSEGGGEGAVRGFEAAVIKRLNAEVYVSVSGAHVMATFEGAPEGHAGVTGITRPVYAGGLGFGLTLSERWGHDTVEYLSRDPLYRKYDHELVTMSSWYAFSENYVLPLASGSTRGTVLDAMNGDGWQKKANLKTLFAFQFAHPGKKLVEMGAEFGAGPAPGLSSLPWHLLDEPYYGEIIRWVEDLGRLYRAEPALYENDFDVSGFEWLDFHDRENSVISFARMPAGPGRTEDSPVIAVFNFTPVARQNYRLGVPRPGVWEEVLNSDASIYGGSGRGNFGAVEASPVGSHGRPWSVSLLLPPLAALFFKAGGRE